MGIGNIVSGAGGGTVTLTNSSEIYVATGTPVTLPASPSTFVRLTIKNNSGAILTIGRNSKSIEGVAADLTINNLDAVTLTYDGTEWWII